MGKAARKRREARQARERVAGRPVASGGTGAFGQEIRPGTISLAVIAKDESRFIEGCLRSVAGFVDEIVVVDTGSTDETVEIAARVAPNVADHGSVYQYKWQNDFALARNQALQHCHGEWILWTDCDEEMRFGDGPIPARRAILDLGNEYGAAVLRRVNYDDDGQITILEHHPRLIRNWPGFCFKGVVHESPVSFTSQGWAVPPDLAELHHWGYGRTLRAAKGKAERNMALVREKLATNPTALNANLDLAHAYVEAKQHADAAEQFRRVHELALESGDTHAEAYAVNIPVCLLNAGQGPEAADEARRVLERYPHSAKGWFTYAQALDKLRVDSATVADAYLRARREHRRLLSSGHWTEIWEPALGAIAAGGAAYHLAALGRHDDAERLADEALREPTLPEVYREKIRDVLDSIRQARAQEGAPFTLRYF